ncbi:MAG: hypothetical protein GY711_06910 [bacterium]|nr:hypothetical protein [bacterium]
MKAAITLAVAAGCAFLTLAWVWGQVPPAASRFASEIGRPEQACKASEVEAVEGPRPRLLAASTPEEVREVIRYCRSAGPERAAHLRSAALASDDPLVVGNAVRALGRLGVFASDVELARLLDDPRQRVRQEAIRALGASGDATDLPRLSSILNKRDPTLGPLAIEAIGRLRDGAGRELLESLCRGTRLSDVERTFASTVLAAMRDS